MIIDLILDRKDGEPYEARKFYRDIMEYEGIFEMFLNILSAMDYGTNEDVRKALCNYIEWGGYNPSIKEYIASQDWL